MRRLCKLPSIEYESIIEACIENGCDDIMTDRKRGIHSGCQSLDLFSGMCRANGHDVNWRIFPLNGCRSMN